MTEEAKIKRALALLYWYTAKIATTEELVELKDIIVEFDGLQAKE